MREIEEINAPTVPARRRAAVESIRAKSAPACLTIQVATERAAKNASDQLTPDALTAPLRGSI
jgi:hypothetical protein